MSPFSVRDCERPRSSSRGAWRGIRLRPSCERLVRPGPTACLTLAIALLAGAEPASSQEGCVLGERGRNDTFIQTLPGVGRITYIGGPHFECDGGVQIFADSAVAYEQRGMSHLMGNVRYFEDGRQLRAAEARYYSNEGRLQAERDVIVVDEEQGASIRDGDLVYLLETDFREESEMTVTVGADGIRPRAVLTPARDTTASAADGAAADTVPAKPYEVVADRIFLRGAGYFAGSGDVVIEQDSLFAYADSAEYDQGADGLSLVGSARVEAESYDLTGRTIVMTDPGGEASEVEALREARLVGDDLLLTSARIVVFLRDGALDRLVATRIARGADPQADSVDLERPEGLVEDFELTADSLEVSAPGERLQRVFASGNARSESTARDSLNAEVLPEFARRDWLEGDTVIIRFQGAPPVPPLAGVADADTLSVGPAGVEGDVVDEEAGAAADSLTTRAAEATDSVVAGPDAEPAVPPLDSLGVDPGDPPPDAVQMPDPEAEEAAVEEIVARGSARSLYRLPPNDSTFRAGADAPAVHYVLGTEIRIRLREGEVEGMTVAGQTRGVHLEPLRRTAPPDSASAADTSAVADTAALGDSALATDTAASVDTTGLGTRRAPEPYDTDDSNPPDGAVRPAEEHPWRHP